MSNYWRKKLDELNEGSKKSSKTTSKSSNTSGYWQSRLDELNEENERKKLAEQRAKQQKEIESKVREDMSKLPSEREIAPLPYSTVSNM